MGIEFICSIKTNGTVTAFKTHIAHHNNNDIVYLHVARVAIIVTLNQSYFIPKQLWITFTRNGLLGVNLYEF